MGNVWDKPIRWIFSGDAAKCQSMIGKAKNQLFRLKLIQSAGYSAQFMLGRNYSDGSSVNVRTDVPGLDIVRIYAPEEAVEEKKKKYTQRHIFFGFDWWGDVIEIDPKMNIEKSGTTESCPSCLSDWVCPWYATDIYSGCVDRYLNTYWGTWQGGVYRFNRKLEQIACWLDWDDSIGDSVFDAQTCIADGKRDYVYFAGDDWGVGYGKIYRLGTKDNTLTNQGMIQLAEVIAFVSSAIGKNSEYVYFGTNIPGRVYRVNLENFSIEGVIDVPAHYLLDAVISDDGKYLIFASHYQYPSYQDGKVVLIRIKDDDGNPVFIYEGSVIVGYHAHALIYYKNHVYVQVEASHTANDSEIVKVKIPGLQIVERILNPIAFGYTAVCYPEIGKGFFGSHDYTSSRGSQIARVNLDKLEIEKVHSFDYSSDYKKLYAGCISKPIEVDIET